MRFHSIAASLLVALAFATGDLPSVASSLSASPSIGQFGYISHVPKQELQELHERRDYRPAACKAQTC